MALTPGSFIASLVSIERIFAWGLVERTILAVSMLGNMISPEYLPRPVTLSSASILT